jgi:hypothetical protein
MSTVSVVRFFRPSVGTGFIRVDRKSTGWLWTRKHGNGTESSDPKAYPCCSDAVSAAGGDTESEFFPKDDDAAHRLLDDIAKVNADIESVRPSELVHRLRRLELNDIGAEIRLLRELYVRCNEPVLDQLPPRTRSRIELLVDRKQIIRALESLPIDEDYNSTRASRTTYFVLSGGKWCPVAAAEERTIGSVRWLNARIDHPDGASSSVSARWPEWAHCTADHLPNVDF